MNKFIEKNIWSLIIGLPLLIVLLMKILPVTLLSVIAAGLVVVLQGMVFVHVITYRLPKGKI